MEVKGDEIVLIDGVAGVVFEVWVEGGHWESLIRPLGANVAEGYGGRGCELAAKFGDGAKDGLFGGVMLHAKGVGDDLDGLVFHVAEDEGGALPWE